MIITDSHTQPAKRGQNALEPDLDWPASRGWTGLAQDKLGHMKLQQDPSPQ